MKKIKDHLIISNIGTASHHFEKYLVEKLSPLSKSQYIVNKYIEFMNYMKTICILFHHKLISFDLKFVFVIVPLDFTIDLILPRIYKDSEIQTNVKKRKRRSDFFYVQKMYILVKMMWDINNVTVLAKTLK